MLWLLSILALGLLVLIHEAGHFLMARACGMKVESFSIGFGPALLTYQPGETEYRLSALPLGGYVRIAGMVPGDGTAEDAPGSFANKPAWQRFLVILAGPFVNWLFAFLLLTALFMVGFQVATKEPIVGTVVEATPAAASGLRPGDRLEAIDGVPLATWAQMTAAIVAHKSKPMEIAVRREGKEVRLTAIPTAEGKLGISPATTLERYPLGEAAPLAFQKTGQVLRETIASVASLFRGGQDAQIMGPVGIVSQTVEAARANLLALLAIMVHISLALSLMNLLPIPALDGGRLLFIFIAMVRRRPVNARVEAVVHAVGMLLLLGLMAYATFGDIGRQMGKAHPATETKERAP
jgi:regulator of sigma E protease